MSQQVQALKTLRGKSLDLRPEPEGENHRQGGGKEREVPTAEWSSATSTELKRR